MTIESTTTNIIDDYEEEWEEESEEEEENYLRNLNQNKKRKKKYPNIIYINRRLSDENNNSNYRNDLNGSNISYTYEDFLTQPLSKSINYEFRQANTINNFDGFSDFYSDSFSDDFTDIDRLNNNSYSNLTECSMKSIENDDLKMEGGMVNTTIYSIIDDEGFLKSVIEKSTSLIKAPEEQNNDQLDEETEATYNQVYNDDNQISSEQVDEDQTDSSPKNNVSFGIRYIIYNSKNRR